MKSLFFSALLFCTIISNALMGQSKSDTIEVRKGNQFYYQGQRLKPNQMTDLFNSVPETAPLVKKANGNLTAGTIFGSAGGFLIGYPLGSAIGGGKVNWAVMGVGAGLAVISLPFYSAYTKHAKAAASLYNSKQTTSTNLPSIRMGITPTGLGFLAKF